MRQSRSASMTLLRATRRVLAAAPRVLALFGIVLSASAQPPTPGMVEEHMKAWYAAWASKDPDTVARIEPPANGFGFRALAPRSLATPRAENLERIRNFFVSMEYFRIELNELHTAVDGDVGLAWGFHTEDFKIKGQAPEKVRVRFSVTLKRERNSWRTLFYHRDIQPFDERGRYILAQ